MFLYGYSCLCFSIILLRLLFLVSFCSQVHSNMQYANLALFFSSENLCKDPFLRRNMDGEGWVPLSVIAGFNKVSNISFVC
jgi:La domain